MMNKRKTMALIVLLVLLVAALSGCSKSGNEGKKGKEDELIPCGNIRRDIVKVNPCSDPFPYYDESLATYGLIKQQLDYLKEFNSSDERNIETIFQFGNEGGDRTGCVRFIETSEGLNAEYTSYYCQKKPEYVGIAVELYFEARYTVGDEETEKGWVRKCVYNINYRTGDCVVRLTENSDDGTIKILEQKKVEVNIGDIKYFAEQLRRFDTSVVRRVAGNMSYNKEIDLKDLLRYFYPLDKTAFEISDVYKNFCNDCYQLYNKDVNMGWRVHPDKRPLVDIEGSWAQNRTGGNCYNNFLLCIMESTQEDFDALLIKD